MNFCTPIDHLAPTNEVYLIDDDDDDNTENIDDINNRRPPPTIGARLLAMYQGVRRSGIVLSVNDKCGTFKMRFDEFPTAEFDYSFSYKSSTWSYIGTAPPPIDPTITSVETIPNEEEPLRSIAQKFKSLIKFMLPPNWELTREQISSMSNDDLSQLDMTVFMHSYREKMTK
ncbi:unnamed protein product, partial [Rotaria magnacalcarata]